MVDSSFVLPARYVPAAYSYIMLASFVAAIMVSPEPTVWPAAIKSLFPSRPVFQVGTACALLPHALTVLLWCWKTRSKTVVVAGITKFIVWVLTHYITHADGVKLSGLLAFLYTLSVAFWMFALMVKTGRGRIRKPRFYIFLAYIIVFLMGLHQLARQLRTGFGQEAFRSLRAVGLLIDIGHEYLGINEFAGVTFAIDWAPYAGV